MTRRRFPKRWTPFVRADATALRMSDPEYGALALRLRELDGCEMFLNNRYQVSRRRTHVYRDDTGEIVCDVIHLSIHNLERTPLRDWRDLQRIKNELIGPEQEAVELFPAESRLVDSSNEFHLWCMVGVRLPFGFTSRLVGYPEPGSGAAQRPWPDGEAPPDAGILTNEDAVQWMRTELERLTKKGATP
jgi:hypothetical protein